MQLTFNLVLAILASVLLPAAMAHAQVYEIGTGGTLSIRDGGGAVIWRDARAAALPPVPPQTVVPVLMGTLPHPSLTEALNQSAARHALAPALLEAVVWQESRWHSGAISPKGAVGLTQLMPATSRALGVDAYDPVANLDGGAHYLRLLLDHFGGDLQRALAAYNAGVARVERSGGIPAIRETQNYVAAILARLNAQAVKP
jgi:soluble lytic murein transglycosylase-like protein